MLFLWKDPSLCSGWQIEHWTLNIVHCTFSTPRGHKSISWPVRAKRSEANPALWVQRHAGAVRLAACPRLILWRLTAYSSDSEENSNRVKTEHCTFSNSRGHKSNPWPNRAKRSEANPAFRVQRHAGRLAGLFNHWHHNYMVIKCKYTNKMAQDIKLIPVVRNSSLN